MICNTIGEEIFFNLVPHPVAAVFNIASILLRLVFVWAAVVGGLQGIRRQGLEGWMVLPAIPLLGIGMFSDELVLLHITINWFFLDSHRPTQMANLLLVVALALLMLRRLLLSSAVSGRWRWM